MFSPSVTRLTPDPTLAIQPALHPERMSPWLAEAIGLRPDERDALSCDAEVLSHKLGQRCTIRYTLRGHAESSRTKLPVTLIGKLYAKRPMAGRLYRRLEALGRGPFESGASLRVRVRCWSSGIWASSCWIISPGPTCARCSMTVAHPRR